MEKVVLVNGKDQDLGEAEKYSVHKNPTKLHRAISVFLFNDKGEVMLTKRSSEKKTWPDFWSNACCSHPRKGEEPKAAAIRRTKEELGIDVQLRFLFKFEYTATYNKEWGENELDHVFSGKFNGKPKPDKNEISEWKFVSAEDLRADLRRNPGNYTPWFKLCVNRVLDNVS